MKKIVFLLSLIIAVSMNLKAQTANNSINHPTISALKVSYQFAPQSSSAVPSNAGPSLQGIPQATLSLKPEGNVSRVYLKIIDKGTNTIIYDINYPINSSIVTNSNGKKLFENVNGTLFISNGTTISIKPYVYEVRTQDAQGNLSTIFSVIQ